MSAGDTARHNYDAARQEILLRMRMRDHVLLVYLIVIGSIFSLSFGALNDNEEILLIIPFIALGVSIIVSQHNIVMAQLGKFCAKELKEFMQNLDPSEYAPQWDNSATYKEFSKKSTNLRSLSNICNCLAK